MKGTDTFCCYNCGHINTFDFSRWGGAEKAGIMKPADLAPSHPQEIRQRIVGDLLWSIEQAKSRGDDQAVAAYAGMLVPLGMGG